MSFAYKLFFEIVNLLFNNGFGYALMRALKLFDAIFVMYPADQEFSDYYTFRFRQKRITYKPFILGVITHPSGKKMLQFAISAKVDQNESNPEGLQKLHKRVSLIKKSIGAKTTHYAGTLPGRFSRLRINRGSDQKNERLATASCVVDAILVLRQRFKHSHHNQVIILGSRGYVGKQVITDLDSRGIPATGVDISDGSGYYYKPHLGHIVVNIMVPGAINEYLSCMDVDTVLLNEVYPAPSSDVLFQMRGRGVKVFHLAGVSAEASPSFPLAYEKAVPCCAAIIGEEYNIKMVALD